MLVDVPGLGDGNLSITRVAIESAKISSAYVYLIDYKHLDDLSDIQGLAILYGKDKGLCSIPYVICICIHVVHYKYIAVEQLIVV